MDISEQRAQVGDLVEFYGGTRAVVTEVYAAAYYVTFTERGNKASVGDESVERIITPESALLAAALLDTLRGALERILQLTGSHVFSSAPQDANTLMATMHEIGNAAAGALVALDAAAKGGAE